MNAEKDRVALEEERTALAKIERLLRTAEMNARLLDGRVYRHRPFAEAYRLIEMLRERVEDSLSDAL